jgi:5-methyltetrahydropteroyltriglutamate--homocysteine methyltransferase
VEAINHGLRRVPAERVRMHICWGNYEGPHTRDIAVAKILPEVLKAKPRGLLFEATNVRHAHEWTAFRDAALPDDLVLIPGCLDSTSNYVEHPEFVAQTLERFIPIVGTARVQAGTDCGFGTFAGFGAVHPSIVWAKFRALSEGARIAAGRAGRLAA